MYWLHSTFLNFKFSNYITLIRVSNYRIGLLGRNYTHVCSLDRLVCDMLAWCRGWRWDMGDSQGLHLHVTTFVLFTWCVFLAGYLATDTSEGVLMELGWITYPILQFSNNITGSNHHISSTATKVCCSVSPPYTNCICIPSVFADSEWSVKEQIIICYWTVFIKIIPIQF